MGKGTYPCLNCPIFGRTHYPRLDERVSHDQLVRNALCGTAALSIPHVGGPGEDISLTTDTHDMQDTSGNDVYRGMAQSLPSTERGQNAQLRKRVPPNRDQDEGTAPVTLPPPISIIAALQKLERAETELKSAANAFSSFQDDGMEPANNVTQTIFSLDSCGKLLADISRWKDDHRLQQRYSVCVSSLRDLRKAVQPFISFHRQHLEPSDHTTPIPVNSDHLFSPSQLDQADTIVQIVTLLVIICNVMIGASERQCMFILHIVGFLIRAIMTLSVPEEDGAAFQPRENHILNHLPLNLDQAYRALGQGISGTPHAICPSCLATYSGAIIPGTNEWVYPEKCSERDLRIGEQCATQLLEQTKTGERQPRLSFVVGSMNDYLARLFSDPIAEQHILDSLKNTVAEDDMTDVFSANFFRDEPWKAFVHQENKTPLSFQLHWDTYNPEGSNRRSDSRSIGVFTLACLNLPVSLRYLPEYLFVISIVPVHPSLDEVNHYLRPIVDRLVEGWNPGIRLTKTALSPTGRTLQLALIISLNDLPAARQIAGLAGVRSSCHCSVCTIKTEDASDNDFKKWPQRDPTEMRNIATQWRDAPTIAARDKIFKEHGIRWSELWRLPYWDPTRMLVIDSMHNLLEGVVAYHCRYVLGFDNPADPAKELAFERDWAFFVEGTHDAGFRYKPEDVNKLKNIQFTLQRPRPDEASLLELQKYLLNREKALLRFIVHCDLKDDAPALWRNKRHPREKDSTVLPSRERIEQGEYEKVPPNTKRDYVEVLMEWRRQKPAIRSPSEPPLNTRSLVTATTATIQHIQKVISETTKPSWVNTVPKNFGVASAGTVKADEWRTLSTIYLPIALVTLWGDLDNRAPPSDSHLLRVLDHTMNLFQAITTAMRYRMNTKRANTYLELMKKYVSQLHGSTSPGQMYAHLDGQTARPNLHASLHIYDFLLLFGPVISWWCFPFERLIGLLQSIPTSNRPGVAEQTVFNSYHRMGTVRRWLRRQFGESFLHFCEFYDKAFLPLGNPNLTERRNSIERAAAYLKAEGLEGRFSPSQTHLGNSVIIYNIPGVSQLFAGEVQRINRTSSGAVFMVKRHQPLPETHHDPFRRYPQFPARTFSSHLSEGTEDIHESQIHSHAMRFDFTYERAILVYLSRQ